MAVDIISPKRTDRLVDDSRYSTLRTAKFFEDISRSFSGLADVSAPVADSATGSGVPEISALQNKMNELLGALRTAGLMEP